MRLTSGLKKRSLIPMMLPSTVAVVSAYKDQGIIAALAMALVLVVILLLTLLGAQAYERGKYHYPA